MVQQKPPRVYVPRDAQSVRLKRVRRGAESGDRSKRALRESMASSEQKPSHSLEKRSIIASKDDGISISMGRWTS
jgi:hypothetical protein